MKIKINPLPKPRMVKSDAWRKRPCVVKYWQYKDELKKQFKGYKLGEVLEVTFVIPMPKSWSKKKKEEMYCQPHKQRPDLDNLIKALQDCLCEEDSHIHTYLDVSKVWGKDGAIIII